MSQLVFNASDHTYTWGGKPVPGVTTVMKDVGITQDFSYVDEVVLADASLLGQRVHAMVETDIKAGPMELDEVPFDLIPYWETWQDFRYTSGFVPLLSEEKLYSQKHGYAGQLDLLGEMNGKIILPDIKRVTAVSRTAEIQTAAYRQLVEENYPDYATADRCVLHFKKGGGWQLVPHKGKSDLRVFLSALNVYNWKRKLA